MNKINKYHLIEPEALVGLGGETIFGSTNEEVISLHMNIEDWLGDDLLTCHPVFFVTEQLKNKLEKTNLSGFVFAEIKQSSDEYFVDNFQLKIEVPNFYWIKIIGKENENDFFINDDKNLMVSAACLKFLKENANIENCQIDIFEDADMDDLFDDL
jgi:hypothetical protein